MATRNFYEADAIGAQLLFEIQEGHKDSAYYAANELAASEETDLLFRLVCFAWWLSEPTDPREMLCADAFLRKDSALLLANLGPFRLPSSSASPPKKGKAPKEGMRPAPVEWVELPADWTPYQAGQYYWDLKAALYSKQYTVAYELTAPLLRQPTVLHSLLQTIGAGEPFLDALKEAAWPLSGRILQHIFAVAVQPLPPLPLPAAPAWDPTAGRRTIITPDALQTWGIRPAPIDRLRGAPLLATEQEACNYWNRVCSETGATTQEGCRILFPTDAQETAFYAHFVNDLPDEWSDDECAKSHGIRVATSTTRNPWRVPFLLCWS